MRVPISHTQNNHSSPNSKIDQPSYNNDTTNNRSNIISFRSPHIPNFCNEPTSVLDIRRSPSPVITTKPTKVVSSISDFVSSQPNDPVEWDEQALHSFDWYSIMNDLGMNNHDSASAVKCENEISNPPEFQFPNSHNFDPTQLVHSSEFNPFELYSNQHNHPNPNNNFDVSLDLNDDQFAYWNVGYEFIDDLIRTAGCFDSNDLQQIHVILERLNRRLRSPPIEKPVGKPLQRASLYFKEALQSHLTGSNRPAQLSSWSEIVQTIRAYKAFSNISPIPMFSHFTTNQALLEALNGSSFIHIIDFDIGLGGQYASLMKELAEKANVLRLNPPVLRITAIVSEEYAIESKLIRENLFQFAQELKIRFQIEFVLLRTFELLSFKTLRFIEGEKTALVLSPCILRRFSSTNNVSGFLSDVRRVSPVVVVFVDSEGWGEGGEGGSTTSFRRNFLSSLEFYAMVLESLDATMASSVWIRKIETFLVRPKIQAAVEAAAERRASAWREEFVGAGMKAVQLSQFADFQAECLLGKVQVRGFHVAKRYGELVLCWHERALVSTSAWKC